MPRTRCYTLKQAVDLILADSGSESDQEPEICILFPDVGADSEVKAIDDDNLSPQTCQAMCAASLMCL